MLRILLIRHSKTTGNMQGRYIGKTDEALCEEGIRLLREKKYPDTDQVYVSPMKRCISTADLLFENIPVKIIDDLRECSFGIFENKNHEELKENPDYRRWIESGSSIPAPGGEDTGKFKQRCADAFDCIAKDALHHRYGSIAIVTHGGTIMSILERYGRPEGSFYDWQTENAGGYMLELDGKHWQETKEVYVRKRL